ncbi:hypothetical protein M5K25_017296 [Dendrobium thyrsiflorum]|uniref:non-specific serine/threonine protein kinase n=1 Tax=Dendrobium thyrsiflorum TaxID=117978 RepID=A0ABD0UTR9_DENTH
MEERYEPLKELGAGNFGVARLVRDKKTKELVAVKYIERGKKIDENVQREIINHRSLRHPNIIRFREKWIGVGKMESKRTGRDFQNQSASVHEKMDGKFVVMEDMLKKLLEAKPNTATSEMKEATDGQGRGENLNPFRGGENQEVEILEGENGMPSLEPISRGEMIIGYERRDTDFARRGVISFPRVQLTPTHLAIIMEYAAGGELFERICNAGRFSEDEEICHRDLKLENTLLDGSPAPRVKICDFGYSKIADVWSCGVTLYVMLVGSYPFEEPDDPKNFRKTISVSLQILTSTLFVLFLNHRSAELVFCDSESWQFNTPFLNMFEYLLTVGSFSLASSFLTLLRYFVYNLQIYIFFFKRITIPEIKKNPWFLKNLPRELADATLNFEKGYGDNEIQSVEEIMRIIQEAKTPGVASQSVDQSASGLDDTDADTEEVDDSGDYLALI